MCVQCPANSISEGVMDTNCMCKPGTELDSGQGMSTISEPCSGKH